MKETKAKFSNVVTVYTDIIKKEVWLKVRSKKEDQKCLNCSGLYSDSKGEVSLMMCSDGSKHICLKCAQFYIDLCAEDSSKITRNLNAKKESQTEKDLHNAKMAFKNIRINIDKLPRYPDNQRHQECSIYLPGMCPQLPFEIRKGEDGYYYKANGKEKKYNLREDGEVSQAWIVQLSSRSLPLPNKSLEDIFEIKEDKSLVNIIRYCIDLYKKSLTMEVARINEELEILNR